MSSPNKRNEEYKKEYNKWLKSLPASERAKLAENGLDKPLLEEDRGKHGTACAGNGFSFEGKKGVSEASAMRLAALAENSDAIEIITNKTPFDDLLTAEEKAARITDEEETAIKQETVSGILSFLFRAKNGTCPSPFDVLCRIYCLTFCIRPQLLERFQTLEEIGAIFQKTKQAISKETLKLKNYGLKARQGKGSWAVSRYREQTTEWHRERREMERKEKRKQYLKEYNAARAEEKKKKNRE